MDPVNEVGRDLVEGMIYGHSTKAEQQQILDLFKTQPKFEEQSGLKPSHVPIIFEKYDMFLQDIFVALDSSPKIESYR